MTFEARLERLAKKHEALENDIEAERLRPSFDDLRIAVLKRRKLRVKDEMHRLQSHQTRH